MRTKIVMIDGKYHVELSHRGRTFVLANFGERKETYLQRKQLDECIEEFKKEIINKNTDDLDFKNSGYVTMPIHHKKYVLREAEPRKNSTHDNANFMGTGMALCGILKEGESLETWLMRKALMKRALAKNKDLD